jgi:hypothetical protein
VAQHQPAIGRRANIHFDIVGSEPDRLFEGRHCVLGVMQVFTSVRDGHYAPGLSRGSRKNQQEEAQDDHVFEMPLTEQCWPSSGHDTPYQISSIRVCNTTIAAPMLTIVSGKS